jgi:hypothetical protein
MEVRMKIRKTTVAVLGALLAISGCSSSNDQAQSKPFVTKIGADVVAIEPYDTLGRLYRDVGEFTAGKSQIFVGTLSGVDDMAVEVQPSGSREGVVPGEGRDIYGRVTFSVTEVIKGDRAAKQIHLRYLSGKRDPEDSTKRIAYSYESLRPMQTSTAQLRSPGELANREFVVFTSPAPTLEGNRTQDRRPNAPEFALAALDGIAEIVDGGALKFGADYSSPVSLSGFAKDSKQLTIEDVRRAAS